MPELPPLKMVVEVLLYAVLPALLSAAGVTLIVRRWAGQTAAAWGLIVGVMVGRLVYISVPFPWGEQPLGAGFSACLLDVLTFQSGESSWNRLPAATLALLCVGGLARPRGDGWLVCAGACLFAAWAVVPNRFFDDAVWLVPALAFAMLAEWAVLDRALASPANALPVFAVSLTFFTASIVAMQAHYARIIDASVALSASFAGIAAIAAWRPVDAGSAAPAAAILLPCFLLMMPLESSSDVPWTACALVGVAPLVLVRGSKPPALWLRVLQFVLVLVILALAVALSANAD